MYCYDASVHSGDLGDLLLQWRLLATKVFLPASRRMVRESWTQAKVDNLQTFAQSQSVDIEYAERLPVQRDYDRRGEFRKLVFCDGWRRNWRRGANLEDQLANFLRNQKRVQDKTERWFNCHPRDWKEIAPIVINRTGRYHSKDFPWKQVVERFGKQAVFVGFQDEHKAFCSQFGELPYYPTETILDLFQVIAGAALFIGNQSTPRSLAEGLKRPVYVEQDASSGNPTYFARPNAWYDLKDFEKVEVLPVKKYGTPLGMEEIKRLYG